MINNLFSIFDPSSSYGGFCWFLLFMIVLFFGNRIWGAQVPFFVLKKKVLGFLFKEVAFTLKKFKSGELTYMIMLFVFILVINVTALFPQVFSLTSHLVVTLPLALVSWLIINLFG